MVSMGVPSAEANIQTTNEDNHLINDDELSMVAPKRNGILRMSDASDIWMEALKIALNS